MSLNRFGIEEFLSYVGVPFGREALLRRSAVQRKELVDLSFWDAYRTKVDSIQIPHLTQRSYGDTVTASAQWNDTTATGKFLELIYELRPWRKGPFELFGTFIDCEWRSNIKWDRIAPHLPPLAGAVVGDFGCNNGYYLFRLLEQNPFAVLGLDPNGRFFYQFDLLHRIFQPKNIFFEPLGVEDAPLFPGVFDLVLCLGVIYHRKDPIQMLLDLKQSLKPGGVAILESITIPGEAGMCLYPQDRYAMMRNVWALPTPETFALWLDRTGYIDIEILDTSLTTIEEQRKTEFAHFDSLSDFLDPNDSSKTIEGYPAPQRTIVKARVPG